MARRQRDVRFTAKERAFESHRGFLELDLAPAVQGTDIGWMLVMPQACCKAGAGLWFPGVETESQRG